MTSKERWEAVLKGEKPDHIPMDIWYTPEIMQKLKKHFGCNDHLEVYKHLRIDRLVNIGEPEYIGPQKKYDPQRDPFACQYEDVDYGTGIYRECVFHPLAGYESVNDLERDFDWPEFNPDWYDFSVLAERVKEKEFEEFPGQAGHWEPFLGYPQWRGTEQAMMDLVLHPEIVHFILNKIFAVYYEKLQCIFETIPGKILVSYVAEDMGSQKDLIYSPAQIKEFFLPKMKKLCDLIHQAGAYVYHHNDGANRKIIPDLIETGIDILNPVQWRCPGMAREGLKQDFGDRLIFHGGVDNQQTLAFGSPQDVRQEVLDNFELLGRGGGYILGPCHAIQSVSPVENILALYETGYEYGWV